MTKPTRRLITTAAALVALFLVSGCKMSPEEKAEKATSIATSKLDLDPTQEAEFQKLAQLAAADYKAMRGERKTMAAEIEKQILSEKADTTAIKSMLQAQSKKRDELTTKWVDLTAGFHSKLKPEQKQKALKLLKKFTDRWTDQDEK